MSAKSIQSQNCFVCGSENPIGLNVPFICDSESASAEFTPGSDYCGFDGIVHGGILFTLVDEAMMHLIHSNEIKAITSEIKIRMKTFARANEKLRVTANSLNAGRHLVKCSAEISGPTGAIVCRAEGKFLYYTEDQPFKKSGL
ncbi:MAG: PaaI family thioesterase [candidate division Zixibacteria bacterium]|nr:PaaI family thioesterase [candidate division Zixibacteria bacterium]